jgi:GT2 family glycosyltransferase
LALFNEQITVIRNGKNLGFGTANNVGIRYTKADFYYLHNSDAYLNGNSLDVAVEAMQKHPSYGIVGLPLVYPDWSPQSSAFFEMTVGKKIAQTLRINEILKWALRGKIISKPVVALSSIIKGGTFAKTFSGGDLTDMTSDLDSAVLSEVGWACGAAMLISAQAAEKSGLFDENIFLYYEDEDLCRRVKGLGFKIGQVNAVPVIHDFGWGKRSSRSTISAARMHSAKYFVEKHFEGRPIARAFLLFLHRVAPRVW